MRLSMVVMIPALVLASACGRQGEGSIAPAPAPMQPVRALEPPQAAGGLAAMLAYEHRVEIELSAARIPAQTETTRQACASGKFGPCVVLGVETQGGEFPSATLRMRAVPAAIEPLIRAAGTGGEIGSRQTRAEDLAVAVADNTTLQDRLRKEHARLSEFQQRRDLSVADMISLSKQMAETEAQLEAAQREGAQHQRRIETQLLTVDFHPPGGQAGRSEIGQAFREFGGIFASAIAWIIRATAWLLPLAIVLTGLFLLVRRLRRRRT